LQNYQAEVGGKVYYAQDRMSEYLGIDTDETPPPMSYDLKDTLKFALQGADWVSLQINIVDQKCPLARFYGQRPDPAHMAVHQECIEWAQQIRNRF
jgi:hypothetical protein